MAQQNTKEKMEAHQAELDGILFRIYDDFKKSKETDADQKWTKKVDEELARLGFAFYRGGQIALDAVYDKTADLSPEDEKAALQEVVKYMDVLEEIEPTNYVANDIRGQAQLSLGDSAAAYKSFKVAGDKFTATPPKDPDQAVAYVFYRKALIDRSKNKNLDAALTNLDMGKTLLEQERARYLKIKENIPADRWEAIDKQYTQALDFLTKFELDILLNSPEKLQEALAKFESATTKEPTNYILHVAYAQLLEKVDLKKAEKIYLKATEIDPNKQIAWFNLGALYVNQGIAKYKEANAISDNFAKAKELQDEANGLYKKAFPFLQKSLSIENCDKEALSTILSICINLSSEDEAMAAEYKKYKDMQTACGM
jgi:predicted Zn-dependent protease